MILAVAAIGLILHADLPVGTSPKPVSIPHFPDPVHALVWRNWQLVPAGRIAGVIGAKTAEVLRMGRAMGLSGPPQITADQQRRSYITVIRRNWHLLPYSQLLELLGWPEEKLAYTLREDDFLYVKLGNLKPKCDPVRFVPSDERVLAREREIAAIVKQAFPDRAGVPKEPLFRFVADLSKGTMDDGRSTMETQTAEQDLPGALNEGLVKDSSSRSSSSSTTSTSTSLTSNPQDPTLNTPLRMCYSYFALYGDPLLEKGADPFPDGYLARLSEVGVNAVWLQGVLYKLAPFPWDAKLSDHYQERLRNLRALAARAKRHGISIYLYLNEPRAMPAAFYATHPQFRGVTEGDHSALCTSATEIQEYITHSVRSICRSVPELGGFFTITASENLTNCWSHGRGMECQRCGKRGPAEVIAEVNGLIQRGIEEAATNSVASRTSAIVPSSRSSSRPFRSVTAAAKAVEPLTTHHSPLTTHNSPRLIAWDWGWHDEWVPGIVNRLPLSASLMSVSEWGIPIERGGVKGEIGEYSLSTIGPGHRAKRSWDLAKSRGLRVVAKIQAANSWELSAVPYIPAVLNTAIHARNLRLAGVEDLMLGWTLGGYPSPNLEVVSKEARAMDTPLLAGGVGRGSPDDSAMKSVAEKHFGGSVGAAVSQFWGEISAAFREFPFDAGTVYSAPLQMGPANPLWESSTGYRASMVGIPYDDLTSWQSIYPPQIFSAQLRKVADGFDHAIANLRSALGSREMPPGGAVLTPGEKQHLTSEIRIAEAAAIHFHSVANQADFVRTRDALTRAPNKSSAAGLIADMERLLQDEIRLAIGLYSIQIHDSRIGFEATNQYYYVPLDLVEKVLNCRDLLDRWLPAVRSNRRL